MASPACKTGISLIRTCPPDETHEAGEDKSTRVPRIDERETASVSVLF
jgi:hypothetical protein